MAAADPLHDYLQALDVLYNHPDSKAKQQADVYLIEFQKQAIAWQISDQILHRAGLPDAAYYYAVGTLYTKIQFNFEELPGPGPRAAFRDSLLSHVKRFQGATTGAIKTKLALCVAALTVRLLAMGEWPNAIGAIVESFGGDFNNALSLLDILAFLPEENMNQRLRMSPLHRATAQIHILSQSAKILGLLMHYLAKSSTSVNSSTNASQDYISSGILLTPNVGPQAVLLPHVAGQQKAMHTKLLATFLSWVKAAHPNQRMIPPQGMPELKLNEIWGSENLVEHPLLLFCFKIIASRCDELEQIAIDVLTSLLRNFSVESSLERNNLAFSNAPGFRSASQYDEDDGAYEEGFERSGDGDDEGQYSSGRYAPRNQASGMQQSKPPVPGELNESENPYKHLYFMRFMATRILNLVPLFEALPAPPADLDDHDDFQSLARYYARLFADLGEYYLQFIVEFCIGPEGFSQLYDALEVAYIKQTMLNHASFVAKKQNPAAGPPSLNENDFQALLVDNQKIAFEIVTLLINCCTNPRRDVNSSAMYFWFLLSENLTQALPRKATITPSLQQTLNPGAAPALTPLQVRANKKQWFQVPFLKMIPNIHRIMTLPPKYAPPGQPSPLSAEAMEEVKKARKQSSETLLDVEKIVGSTAILEMLTSEKGMGAQVAAIMADPSKWRELEASLLMVRVLGKVICQHTEQVYDHMGTSGFATGGKINTEYLPKILEFILMANSPVQANQALKYTSLELVGRYASWFKEQSRAATAAAAASGTGAAPVDYVSRVLGFIVNGLQDLKVIKGAAIAFNRVCDKNRNALAKPNFLPGIFQVYQGCCNVNLVDQSVTAQGYTLSDQKQIIEGVATVVSCIQSSKSPAQAAAGQQDSSQVLPHYLHQLVLPMLSVLESFLKQLPPVQPGMPPPQLQLSADASATIATNLDRLGETIAKLYPSLSPDREYFLSCLLELFHTKISPVLYTLLQRASADERRMDKLCRVIKHVIKITKLHFLNVCLGILLENLNQSFSRFPHACFLYLLGICVEHYGMIPSFHPVLKHMLPSFLATSIKLIPNLHAMQQSPEMTEDFFQTCTTILDKCPEVLFSLELLPLVIETAIQGLHLQHRESHSALCCFLNHFFLHGVESHAANEVRIGPVVPAHANVIQQCVQKYGSIMTNACVRGIATQLPMNRVEGASRVLEGIVNFCREGCLPWLNDALSRVPDTIDPTKQEFVRVLIEYPDERSVCNVSSAFARASRIKDEP